MTEMKNHGKQKMKKTVQRAIFILLVIGIIVSAVLLVRHRKSELANLAPPDIRPVPVHIKTVETGRLPTMEHYLGTIAPVAEAVLSAQTTGYIVAMQKDVGDRVTAGELAAQIDNRLAVSRKNALAAELAGAREDVKIKKIIRDRRQELLADKAVSKESFDQAFLDYALAVSRVQRLEQELEAAAVSLSFVSIRSLFDGVVSQRMKDPGDLVMPGTPVYKVEDARQGYKVMVHIPPEVAAAVSPDAPLRLISGENIMDATVYRVHPSITNGNLAALEIRVRQRPFKLPSYATVGVDLVTGVSEGFLVDSDCILEQETGAFVFEVQDNEQVNKTVRPVPVEVLGRHQDRAIVQGDVSPGMMLAAGPESMLLQLSRHGRVAPISGKAQ
jgi:RND family efflux transporter MFP subunit